MRACYCFILFSLALSSAVIAASPVAVIDRDGEVYVDAALLETSAGIAVKRLPGQDSLAVCHADRCVLVKEFVEDDGRLLLLLEAVREGLNAELSWDPSRQSVEFQFEPDAAKGGDVAYGVGQLAPEIRLRRLDGSPIALSELRGKRVIINSWASW